MTDLNLGHIRPTTRQSDFAAWSFSMFGSLIKDVKAPQHMEMADVAWPLISHFSNEVSHALMDLRNAGLVAEGDVTGLLTQLTTRLYSIIFSQTSRVMVQELAAAESTGLLFGETTKERYSFFIEMLDDHEFCEEILQQHPILRNSLINACRNWRDAIIEFTTHLIADFPRIRASFLGDLPLGTVRELSFGEGDCHKNGRTTCLITFSRGHRLVYKPRPHAAEAKFELLLDWINSKLPEPALFVPRTVDGGEYGWSEFIDHRAVTSTEAFATFYRRLGATMCVAYLVGLSDLHAENLIAHGAKPFLVDLETLFKPLDRIVVTDGAAGAARHMLYQSVMSTHLVGAAIESDDENAALTDLGGLADLSHQKTPFKIPEWVNLGSVDMRLDYDYKTIGEAQNIPFTDNETARAEDYIDEICDGFAAAYRVIAKHKEALCASSGLLSEFNDVPVRVVLRGTFLYAQTIRDSFHPDFLNSSEERDRFFDNLLKMELPRLLPDEIKAAELRDLWNADVPYFWMQAGGTAIHGSDNTVLSDTLFASSGTDAARKRILDLDETDLERQLWIINASLTLADSSHAVPMPKVDAVSAEDPGRLAHHVTESCVSYICSTAIPDRNGNMATWLVLREVPGGRLAVEDAGLSFYNGLPGIALFLAYAGKLLRDSKATSLARNAVREMLRRLDNNETELGSIQGFSGVGGLVYAMQHLSHFFPDLPLRERAVELQLNADIATENIDVMDGLSGLLLAACTLRREISRDSCSMPAVLPRLNAQQRMIGDQIVSIAKCRNETESETAGFAHGNAGVGLALARLHNDMNDCRYEALARELLGRASRTLIDDNGNDLGQRQIACRRLSWCRGSAGILPALFEAPGLFDDFESLVLSVRKTLLDDHGHDHDHSLCHGYGGVSMLIASAPVQSELGSDQLQQRFLEKFIRSLGLQLRCGTINSTPTPGLMDGIAGIGLAALSTVAREEVPTVLTLDAPRLPATPVVLGPI